MYSEQRKALYRGKDARRETFSDPNYSQQRGEFRAKLESGRGKRSRDDDSDGNLVSRKVDLWKARRLETCTTGLGRGVRDIRAQLWENQSLQPMQRALRLLYIKPNRCHIPKSRIGNGETLLAESERS